MNQNSSNNSSSRRLSSNDTDLSANSMPVAMMTVTDTSSDANTDSSTDPDNGGYQLKFAYDDWSLAAFDSNEVLKGNIAEDWDSQPWPDSNVGTINYSSAEGSHLTYKFNSSGSDSDTETKGADSVGYNFIGTEGNTLKINDAWKWTSSGVKYTQDDKSSVTYQEGASTKGDKTDDLKLTITSVEKTSTENEVDSGTSTVNASYSDGMGYKWSLKASSINAGETSTITVSDLSYSDADGNKFKFSGTFDETGTIQLKSASLTIDGETIKFGKQPITADSEFNAFNLVPLSDGEPDFNGSDVDGMGHVADFVVLLGNWVDFNSSLG